MKQLTCEMCGSTDLMKQDGVFICQTCGTKYSVEEAKKMMVEGTVNIQGTVKVTNVADKDSFLKRGYQFLEQRDFKKATEYFEKVLDIDPECGEAYMGLLCVDYKKSSTFLLLYCPDSYILTDNDNYKKALKYGNEGIRQRLLKEKERYYFVNDKYAIHRAIHIEGTPDIRSRTAYNYVTGVKAITIADDVYSIRDEMFQWCSNLESVTIPGSVTHIGEHAFSSCKSLTSITIPGSVINIGEYAFWCCESLASITIPGSVINIGEHAFTSCNSLTSITIPEGVTNIGEHAFSSCKSLTSITIPKSVTKIGNSAFSGCSALTSITIPESVTKIGEHAFWQCESLTSITIPGSVTKIGEWTFRDCKSLTSITIPESVTEIGKSAFSGCSALTSITIPGSVTEIGNGAFRDCSALTSITIPGSVTEIGNGAFRDCSALTSITIPESVTKIGGGAFSGCDSLVHIQTSEEIGAVIRQQAPLKTASGGCYVATAVYGSYDCPQVWTLRRFRDDTLAKTWYGRTFIRTYYAISPTLVKWFGTTEWFKKMWQGKLDRMVTKLQSEGVESTPYEDRKW